MESPSHSLSELPGYQRDIKMTMQLERGQRTAASPRTSIALDRTGIATRTPLGIRWPYGGLMLIQQLYRLLFTQMDDP